MDAQESFSHEIFDHMLEGCQIIDFDWRYRYLNDVACRQARKERSDLVGRTMAEAYPGIEGTPLFNDLTECMQNRSSRMLLNEFAFLDGDKTWFELSIHPVPEGLLVMSLDVDHDQHAVKQAQDKVTASETRYRGLFEHMTEGFAFCRMLFEQGKPVDFIYLDVNGSFERLTALNGVIGKKVTEVIPGICETNPELFEIYGRVALTAAPERFETYVPSMGIWFSVSVYSFEKGTFVAVFDNITARKHAEQALRDREALYHAVIDTTSDGFWVADDHGRFLEVNAAYVRLSGYSRDELLSMRISDVEATEGEEDVLEHIAFVRQKGVHVFETQHRAKDGRVWQAEVSVSFWPIAGGRIFTFARDITERKSAEQTLRQHLAELEALHTVSAELRSARTLDDALSILIDKTLSALQAEAGAIWMYHPDNNELRVAASRAWLDDLSATNIPPGQGIVGRVFTSGETLHMPELEGLLKRPNSSLEEVPRGWGGACVPIRTSDEIIGVLCISMPIRQSMTADQSRLLSSLAELAGITLQRMRLHEETLRRLEQLQALRQVDQSITSNLDMKVSLNVVLEQAISQLGVEGAIVHLHNPSMRTLEWAAGRGVDLYAGKKTPIRLGKNLAGQAALQRRTLTISDLDPALKDAGQPTLPDALLQRFATHCAVPLISKGEVKGVLEVYHHKPLDTDLEWVDFLETLAGQAAITIDNSQLFENLWHANLELSIAYDATIEGWSRALDLRDKETEGHSKRVTEMTMQLAAAMGMKDDELIHIRRGCLLHDIGKLGVPDYILHKTGPLTEDEWELMRKHPVYAREMLLPIQFLHSAIDIPYRHHEKWDGTGYPSGLKANEIPLSAQIFAIVDVWDALTSDRPYRPAWPAEKAEAYLREQSGKHFNPLIVPEFIRLLKNS